MRRILDHLGPWARRAMQREVHHWVPRPGRRTPTCRSPITRYALQRITGDRSEADWRTAASSRDRRAGFAHWEAAPTAPGVRGCAG